MLSDMMLSRGNYQNSKSNDITLPLKVKNKLDKNYISIPFRQHDRFKSIRSEVRKSRDFEPKLQPDTTWQPTLIDYISLNDQVLTDNRSVNTRL